VEAQLVTAWHRIPYDMGNQHGHLVFPDALSTDGKPPSIWFERRSRGGLPLKRTVQHHDERPLAKWRYSPYSGNTTLAHHSSYSLHMEGSELQHDVVTNPCTTTHPFFRGNQPGWVVAVTEPSHGTIPPKYAWLVAQHALHHRCLGMHGLIVVTTPANAYRLTHHPDTADALRAGALVVVALVGVVMGRRSGC
jgi:hypothetical protein